MKKLSLALTTICCLSIIASISYCNASTGKEVKPAPRELSLTISKRYLNIPISHSVERAKMNFEPDGKNFADFVVRLAPSKPDYWVFYDVSAWKGKVLKIKYAGQPEGLSAIYQSDVINGQDSLYHESNRPQIHFSTRRGWINDPNGLIFYEGEYHLYYQHNPFEREWENMSWGHAVSKDLIHWEELPIVMVPDKLGAMFSGTAVIDYNNTSGFGKDGIPPMVVIYTVDSPDNERQCIAYSLDKGRTFTKYERNPVLDTKSKWNTKDLRDPKVFWHLPSKSWVMVLYERDGNSIYTSANLKEWQYQSHTEGFFECPQFFELAVDGNKGKTKWVMYGASGTYMLGSFDGKKYIPESGKYYYGNGAIYAAQTFENIPAADGRRIQIGWGRIVHPGMPFRHMMLLPTEMTLRTTKEGVRLFNTPVQEVNKLQDKEFIFTGNDPEKAEEFLKQFRDSSCLRIKTTIKLSHATTAGFNLYGQSLLKYDMNYNLINGMFYAPENRTSMELSADIILDKTSFEVFIDRGVFSYAGERRAVPGNNEGYRFLGKEIEIKSLKIYTLKSIWKN